MQTNKNKTKNHKIPFFVELKPTEMNKALFHITSILHTKIKIEKPHKRPEIVQCFNCQNYGHFKSYCFQGWTGPVGRWANAHWAVLYIYCVFFVTKYYVSGER
jgi:hypothetical protein